MKQFFKTDSDGNRTDLSQSSAIRSVVNGLGVTTFDALSLIEAGLGPKINGFTFDVEAT